jgi:hypothetical protein
LVVDSIDSINVNGQYRKRITIIPLQSFNGWTYPWIEGIGSTASLTDYFYPHGNYDVHLSCFFGADSLSYGLSEDCCIGVIDHIEQNSYIDRIRVYPNPANDVLTIDANSIDFKQIEILNIQNCFCKAIATRDSIINIDINEYPKGIYLLKIITDSKIIIKKIIII